MRENEKYEKKIVTEFQKMMMETTIQNTKKEPENTREILKDISKIDVTRKKRKINIQELDMILKSIYSNNLLIKERVGQTKDP